MYTQYILLFALMFTGYFFRKINFIDNTMNNGINRLIVYFAYPCLIVHNIGNLEMNKGLLIEFMLMVGVSVVTFTIYSVYAYYYSKVRKFPKKSSNIVEFSTIMPNDGFMGFPVALLFLGEKGLFFMLAHNVAMNLFCFTYGYKLVRRNKEGQRKLTPKALTKAIFRLIVNPNILALILGLTISIIGVKLPQPVDDYLVYIGNIVTPMAMIFIGSTLAKCKVKEIMKNHIVIEASINKLIILPIITFGAVMFLPLSQELKAMVILGCCFPTAATVSMIAQQEGEDQKMSSMILFLSTVLSLVTIQIAMNMLTTWIL
ncbi:MAG: AEC family transporter [Anaerovoracaceae bacterium]